jgi:hypothetical protein
MVFVYQYHTHKSTDPNIKYLGNVEKTKLALFVAPFVK